MIQQQNYSYEILILDRLGKSEITTVKSLSKALGYSEKLWAEANIQESTSEAVIDDSISGVSIKISKIGGAAGETLFLLSAKSPNFEKIEPFRYKLLNHVIHKLGFDQARILTDAVSEKIAQSIYALVKEAENGLRKKLNKTFAQKSGANWLESIASKATLEKVSQRKNFGNPFEGLVDTQVSLTDFNDLLDLVQKAGLSGQSLKTNLETLSILRDKVLTYAPLVKEDYNTAHKAAKDLLLALGDESLDKATFEEPLKAGYTPAAQKLETLSADAAASRKEEPLAVKEEPTPRKASVSLMSEDTVPATKSEVGASLSSDPVVSEAVASKQATTVAEPKSDVQVLEQKRKSDAYDIVTESVFLSELKQAESREKGAYVNLKSFVTEVLGDKGYAAGPAYTLSRTLNESGKVTISDIKDSIGLIVKAIRSN